MQRIEFNGWELKHNIMICQQAYAKKKKNWFANLGYIMSWVRPQMKTTVKSTQNTEPWRRACPHCTQ